MEGKDISGAAWKRKASQYGRTGIIGGHVGRCYVQIYSRQSKHLVLNFRDNGVKGNIMGLSESYYNESRVI